MKVVKKSKKQVLLQDETGYQFYITRELYDSGEEEAYLENSIPYSLNFSDAVRQIAEKNAGDIEEKLYKAGVHSVEDVLSNRRTVNNVLRKYISAQTVVNEVKS